ncbi:hypothetical protein LDENG_00159310 [Lucifuga dentata]|nr:hypothetical protein LDENG_00159310 [Lucifuga dentata]
MWRKNCKARTIHRQFNERGFYGRRPRRTPLLRETRKPSWSLSKHTLNKPKSFWENILRTDETKLELFGKSHKFYVYRKKIKIKKKKKEKTMSPDLNPTEHLWRDLKTAAGRRHPSNLRELEQLSKE